MKKDLMPSTLYLEAVKTLPACDIDHHASDLYLRVTKASEKLFLRYEYQNQVSTFVSNIDGKLWFEFPFCFLPFWEAKDKSRYY